MYLVLRPPWGGGGATAPVDAGVAQAPADAGSATKKKPRGNRPRHTSSPDDTEETEPIALTDADRRLEWRGDDTALPARKLDMTSEARALEQGEINATVSGQSGAVQDCVVQGATGTDLRATITIELLVDGTGKVTKSRLQAPHYLFEKGLLGCAQRALGRMRFPATGAPTKVTFPVHLG